MKRKESTASADGNTVWMGRGYNVFGGSVLSVDNLLGPVIDTSGDAVVVAPDTRYEGNAYTCETATQLQETFDVAIGLKGSYGGFSGELKAKYGVSTEESGEYGYGWTHQRADIHQIGFKSPPSYDMLCEDAKNLPSTYGKDNEAVFYRFFMRYGTHYVHQITTGGRIDMYTKWSKEQQYSKRTVSASMQAQYKAVLSSAEATVDANWSKVDHRWFEDSSTDISAAGGDVTHLLHGPLQYNAYISPEHIDAWRQSLHRKPAVTRLWLKSVADIFNDGHHDVQYHAVRAALDDFLGNVITITSFVGTGSSDLFIGPNGGAFDFPGKPHDPGIFILSRADLSLLSSYYLEWVSQARSYQWLDHATGKPTELGDIVAEFDNLKTFLVFASAQTHFGATAHPTRDLLVAAQPDGFLGGYQSLVDVARRNSDGDSCLLNDSMYSFITWGTPSHTRDGEDTYLYTGPGTTESRGKLTLVVPVRFDEVRQDWYVPQI